MSEHWSNRYIGLPYREFGRAADGVDCWGLACLVYAAELGITLPDYLGYGSVEEHAEIAGLVAGATASTAWTAVVHPKAFDVAVFRRGRFETHVGIVVQTGLMLHVAADDQAKLEHYMIGRWGNRRSGIYRHRTMIERGVA